MTKIVNLRQARKQKARKDREKEAEANRAKSGRTKSERTAAKLETTRHAKDLDGKRLDKTSKTSPKPDKEA